MSREYHLAMYLTVLISRRNFTSLRNRCTMQNSLPSEKQIYVRTKSEDKYIN